MATITNYDSDGTMDEVAWRRCRRIRPHRTGPFIQLELLTRDGDRLDLDLDLGQVQRRDLYDRVGRIR